MCTCFTALTLVESIRTRRARREQRADEARNHRRNGRCSRGAAATGQRTYSCKGGFERRRGGRHPLRVEGAADRQHLHFRRPAGRRKGFERQKRDLVACGQRQVSVINLNDC